MTKTLRCVAARIMRSALTLAVAAVAAIASRAAEVAHFVEYIESDGAGSAAGEYVMLDYKPTARSVVEMDVTPLDLSFNSAAARCCCYDRHPRARGSRRHQVIEDEAQ